MNEETTQVTLNLEAALRHIRKSSHAITLWVDAICINQNDVAEKNHQVEMMREIFSGAELVIAWLGSASEDSDLALEMLATGLDPWTESGLSEYGPVQRTAPPEVLAIAGLLTRSWWSRIWVVQEILLAKKFLFKCGDAELPGEQITDKESSSLWVVLLYVNRDSISCYTNALEFLEDIFEEENVNAVDYLNRYRRRQATKPHDHIYGLFGVLPSKDQILLGAPNYDCRVEDLFITVANKLMLQQRSLTLLQAAACTSPTANSSTKIYLPSWVPDWTRPISIGSKQGLWPRSSDVENEAEFQFSGDGRELMLDASEIEKIESVKPVLAFAERKMPIWQDVLETRHYKRSPPLEGVVAALFIFYWVSNTERLDSEDEEGFRFLAAFFQELEEYRVSLLRDEAGEVHNKADYLAGFLEWTGDSRDGRTDEEILEKVLSVQAAREFVQWYHSPGATAKLQAFYMHYSFLRRFRPQALMFRTIRGFFGITATAEVAPGDMLCIVPTCAVPVLFREVGSSKHRLIGSCDPIAGRDGSEMVRKHFTLV